MIQLALFFLAEAEGGGHEETFLLNPHSGGLVFWTAVTFAVVLLVLRKTAWGPLLEGLEKRERTIADAIAAAQNDRIEAAKLLEEHRKKIEQVRTEAQQIILDANAGAKRLAEEVHAKALAEAEATKLRAIREIEQAKHKALDELRTSCVELSFKLAEKVLGAEVDRAKQRRLVDEFVKSYEKN